jgi:hypothetical protein
LAKFAVTNVHVFLTVGIALAGALVLVERAGELIILGEIHVGVILGVHVLRIVDPSGTFTVLAAIGSMVLLFDAGYEEIDLGEFERGVARDHQPRRLSKVLVSIDRRDRTDERAGRPCRSLVRREDIVPRDDPLELAVGDKKGVTVRRFERASELRDRHLPVERLELRIDDLGDVHTSEFDTPLKAFFVARVTY